MLKDHCKDVTDVKFQDVVPGTVALHNVWFYQDRTCPFMTYAHLTPAQKTGQQDLAVASARGLSALQARH